LKQNSSAFATRDTSKKEVVEEKPKCQYIPFNNYLHFEAAKLDGLSKKLMEFNAELNILDE
jgi:hypothetical protein